MDDHEIDIQTILMGEKILTLWMGHALVLTPEGFLRKGGTQRRNSSAEK
jgi:hypothetical protein